MINRKRVGLALSGGGYRAVAFHLGVFKKLNELKILDKIDVISTISGGSIAGAYYLLKKDNFNDFYNGLYHSLQKSILKWVFLSPRFLLTGLILLAMLLSSFILAGPVWGAFFTLFLMCIILIFFHNIFPTTNLIAVAYDNVFFQKKCIGDFSDTPDIAINAVNIETGTLWAFSKRKIGDSSYTYPKYNGPKIKFKQDKFPISLAVAASTAVPYLFNPVVIKVKYFENPKDQKRIRPSLVDGGVYDNQGIHKITQKNSSYKCDIIICSDASSPFKTKFRGINPYSILKRVEYLLMRRIKTMQFIRDVYQQSGGNIYEIAYYSLDWQYEKCIIGFVNALKHGSIKKHIIKKHNIENELSRDLSNIPPEKIVLFIKEKIDYNSIIQNGLTDNQIKSISKISTNLIALKKEQLQLLVRHAEVLTELQLKLYCPVVFHE
jgi:NTE family protein